VTDRSSRPVRARFAIAALALSLLLGACAAFDPQPVDVQAGPNEIQEKTEQAVTVSTTILSDEQALRLYGVDLADVGLQAVWLRIENDSEHAQWLLVSALDPNYFPPDEAAVLFHPSLSDEDEAAVTRHFRELAIPLKTPAGGTSEGYVLAPRHEGGRYVMVKLVNNDGILNFGFAVTLPDDAEQIWNSVAISSSIHTDADTHIEVVTYGQKGDFMKFLFTLLTGKGGRWTRIFLWLGNIVRHPVNFLKSLWPIGWSRRTLFLLVMQSLDNAIAFRPKKRLFGDGVRLTTEQDADKPNPTYIEAGNKAAEWIANWTGGYGQSMLLEAVANIPTTAHILGGAVVGSDATRGVVDSEHRVFGYQNMLICDGSVVPANPGVNPSLTICAMSERAMSKIPTKER
jgi:choline dehydrogenase-like flavoprotein